MSKAGRWIAFSFVCALVTGVAATAATARTTILSATTGPTAPLVSAIYDPIFQTSQANTAFAMARQAGASYARIDVSWRAVAPVTQPSSWNPSDPNSPYYHWSSLDATVSAAHAHGVQPILDIVATPTWGFAAGSKYQPGAWTGGSPDITKLGQFATALASRYDNIVKAYSVWNEPNFNRNFSPQDPVYYRNMVNAVADAVHAVDPTALALAGELAPFKHPKTKSDPNNVIAPITWMQQMLCVSATAPVHATCAKGSAHFDVWTHHPYSDTGPFGHATVSGGVELGDLPKMTSLLKTAWTLGTIQTQSGQAPPFWVTEIGWSSNPPNRHGVPLKLETRWVAEAFYQLWKSGATLGTWFLLQDEPSSTPFQSGLYTISNSLSNAVAKPLLDPFTLPFVAYLKSGGKVQMWGRDATSDTQNVAIQRKVNGSWKTLATITSNNYGIFQAKLGLHAASSWTLRAQASGVNSAGFSLTVPASENKRVVPFPLN
jgi:hypothetical protein